MNESKSVSPAPRKRRIWPRILIGIVALVVVLIVAAYFVVTSSAFLKGAILPRVSESLHANVTVSGAAIHPFREIDLRDLKVQTAGQEPILTAPEVLVRYSLFDIIGGKIHVDELTLTSPTISLVENPDGSSNLDALTKTNAQKTATEKKETQRKPSKPTQLDIGKITISHATILKIKNYAGGHRDVIALTNFDLTVSNVRNGQQGKAQLSAGLNMEKNPPTGTNGFLEAALKGDFDFALTSDLKPATVNGALHADVANAGGSLSEFSALAATVNCDATPAEIRKLALNFQKNNTMLGELTASGPFDSQKMEGKLKIVLDGVDQRLLNIFGAPAGMDFGTTMVSSTNEIQLAKNGSQITAIGNFALTKMQLHRANETTPTLDVNADYDVTVDSAAKSTMLRAVNVNGTQNGNPLLIGKLSQPMSIAWGNAATKLSQPMSIARENATNEVGNSTFDLVVTNLNLADWKGFLGGAASAGNAGLTLKLSSQQAGSQLTFDLASRIENLSANLATNQTVPANVTLQARGTEANLQQFIFSQYELQIAQQNQPVLNVSGSGNYNKSDSSADLQVALKTSLARLLQIFPQANLNVTSGDAELKGHVVQKQNSQSVTGTLTLAEFSGAIGQSRVERLGAALDLDVNRTPTQIQIVSADGKLTQAGAPAGAFEISGNYDTSRKSGKLNAKVADVNQNFLRPFLEPSPGGKKLKTVLVNANITGQYDPQSASALKGILQFTNLVVEDPQHQIPATPLAAGVTMDASLQPHAAELRQLQIALTPTSRAANELNLTGKVDFSRTNAIQGNLLLASDALDLTSYYDLFAGKKENAPSQSQTSAPVPEKSQQPASPENQEPAAVHLPFTNFVVMADIKHFYLRELAITNFQTTVKIDGGHVLIKPLQLALNGAPASATVDLDLGVLGYKYDVALDGKNLPFAPIVNTFAPERKGELGGTLTATLQIKGAGITGSSLQKNLAGQFDIGTTNLNLQVVNVRSRMMKILINVIAAVPELLSSPDTAIGSLLGIGGGHGRLMDELQKSPIDVVTARGNAGGGKIKLDQAVVRSAAFEADAQGDVTIEAVLTNSPISIPVTVSLSRQIAGQLNMANAQTPTNQSYVPLPQFFTETGSVGDPKANVNKTALLGVAAQSLGKGIFGRQQSTNQSPVAPVENLLEKFLKKK